MVLSIQKEVDYVCDQIIKILANELYSLAKKRIESLKMVNRISGSHIGSALSMTDILAVLYSDILKFDPLNPNLESR